MVVSRELLDVEFRMNQEMVEYRTGDAGERGP